MRVRVSYDGAVIWVNLPEYSMVPGSFKPIVGKKIHADGIVPGTNPLDPTMETVTCEVLVPLRITDGAGRLSKDKIRILYEGQEKWDRDDVTDDVVYSMQG
jgi:hypothetical protein